MTPTSVINSFLRRVLKVYIFVVSCFIFRTLAMRRCSSWAV